MQVHIDYISILLRNMAVLEQIQGEYTCKYDYLSEYRYSFKMSTHTHTSTWVLRTHVPNRYSHGQVQVEHEFPFWDFP